MTRAAAHPLSRRLAIPEDWDGALLALLAAANFALVYWTFRASLTILPNTGDEFSALFQAKIFASGRLTAPAPARADVFAADYIAVRGGRWFSIYPPVPALLLAVGVLLGDATLIPAALSSAALAAAFLAARRAGGRGAAWLTAGLLFFSPTFRSYGASYYSHVPALLAATLCVLLALNAAETRSRGPRAAAAFAAAAVLGLASRPFELFWVLIPVGVFLLAEFPREKRLDPRRLLPAAAVALAGLAALAAFNARLSGGFASSVYLRTVNAGGRLDPSRNLSAAGLARLAHMCADAAKWLLGAGYFPSGSLKEVSASDLNFAWPLLAAAFAFGWFQSRGAEAGARARRLLLGVAASAVLGHLFYDKAGGRFGERRLFEVSFAACFFAARLYLALVRRLPDLLRAPVLALLLLAPAALYSPGTLISLRNGTETRMDPYLRARRAGLHDALIFLRSVPEFYPSFYARNDPDLRGNVYAVDAQDRAATAALLPGRRRYVYAFDWPTGSYVLAPDPAAPR